MQRLFDDRSRGRVDTKAEPLLGALNALRHYYTTSSCAGRVQLISVAGPGDKRSSRRWGIWHDAPAIDQVQEALDRWMREVGAEAVLTPEAGASLPNIEPGTGDLLYLQTQSPIFHVACQGLEPARRLRALAVNCGWKYSSLRGFKGVDPLDGDDWDSIADGQEVDEVRERTPPRRLNRVMVELLSSERLDTPLARGERLYIHGTAVAFAVEVARLTLDQTQARLPRLLEALKKLD